MFQLGRVALGPGTFVVLKKCLRKSEESSRPAPRFLERQVLAAVLADDRLQFHDVSGGQSEGEAIVFVGGV